ncbi:MAG: universal stress protein [Bacteroidota bacterium]
MSIEFKNILIPVDFSINTEIAIKKAIGLVAEKDAVIHLLHVLPSIITALTVDASYTGASFPDTADMQDAEKKLKQWKYSIIESFPGISIETHLRKGHSIQQQVIRLAKQLNPQLIIIGKHNYHNWFSFLNTITPSKLAKGTNCPVLTVKMGSLHNKIRSIVFPVQSFVPNRKIALLVALVKRYRARVYLIILVDPPGEANPPLYDAFIDTYRMLKASLNCPIEHEIVTGTSLAKEALHFAEKIQADMILLHPDAETRLSSFTKQQVSDVVKGNSKLEVLSVEP